MKIVILDNIRSALNVGSIFRTASGIGVDKIYLCGITPTPYETGAKFKNLKKKRKDFVKTALGAEDEIPYEYRENVLEVLRELREEDFYIVALEQSPKSIDYKKVTTKGEQSAILVGNEVSGLNTEVLSLVNTIAEIPMKGKKESLNVVVAFGIFAYHLWDT